MCCRKRRAARQAWLERRAAGGGRCGRGPGGPRAPTPFAGGGPFGQWQDLPPDVVHQSPSQYQQVAIPRNEPAAKDIEKGTPPGERDAGRASFMAGALGRWRDSIGSDAKREIKRESTNTLPPKYTAGVSEVPQWPDEKAAAKRGSLPPNYDAATKS
ncbi:hypothetical protein CH063_03726 [Colletotrichum higginsianum]|uniref:Uncharacterized protein n=2 Tax=Colletotrichum higginsianum TaxID=80884 RepID=H1W096_COLHI|nr:uncharacterized protein CH63R_10011 [Colletotrichum higginsianum IMI 349063]OBR05891.1 hypothetical protein CH63R_10011 [Colletotrichum higginsianum IMI 349063]TIC90733.1 hypothetical protein CH35J_011653 [Colletotrichum higginsianum]CCF45908.1 hypothetical protein CH063_03726 [Colletotrichum higginsianum]